MLMLAACVSLQAAVGEALGAMSGVGVVAAT